MTADNTVSRSLHDLGLATWFGGSLMGAVGLNGAAAAAEGGTDPRGDTPEDVAKAQRQLKVLQRVIPALTGAVLVLNARMGEQQRPAQVSSGLLGRLRPGRAA